MTTTTSLAYQHAIRVRTQLATTVSDIYFVADFKSIFTKKIVVNND
jgi:hypothetical protein